MDDTSLAHLLDSPPQSHGERLDMAIKQIPIEALTIGMYVVRLDRPWPLEADLKHRHRIEGPEDIEMLKGFGVHRVIIDPTLGLDVMERPQMGRVQGQDPLVRELATARRIRAEALTAIQGIFEGVKTGVSINSTAVRETVHGLMDTILRRHDPLISLIHMQRYDVSMFAHALNVCTFALVVGKYQGYNTSQLEYLGMGGLLHDVGELRLPRNLMRKSEPLGAQERRLIQQHPWLGVAILAQAQDVHDEVRRIVLEHHERLDGSGYPAGLKGLSISPLSEIVGIADIYDALLSHREGRPALPPAQAIKELYQEGLRGTIDKRWVEIVIRCLGIYPVGSLVELNTGERGVVVAANPLDATRPTVRIVWNGHLQPYAEPLLVNLARPHEPSRSILRALNAERENIDVEAYLTESTPIS